MSSKPTREQILAALAQLDDAKVLAADRVEVHPAMLLVLSAALEARMPRERPPDMEGINGDGVNFRVIVEKTGCGHCGRDQTLSILYPNDTMHHTSYEGLEALEEAESECSTLQYVFDLGREVGAPPGTPPPGTKSQWKERALSAEAVVRQVARDTYGEDMTPKEFADKAGYDS